MQGKQPKAPTTSVSAMSNTILAKSVTATKDTTPAVDVFRELAILVELSTSKTPRMSFKSFDAKDKPAAKGLDFLTFARHFTLKMAKGEDLTGQEWLCRQDNKGRTMLHYAA